MKELKRNKDTGEMEVWEDGKKVGIILGMGDLEGGERDGERIEGSDRGLHGGGDRQAP